MVVSGKKPSANFLSGLGPGDWDLMYAKKEKNIFFVTAGGCELEIIIGVLSSMKKSSLKSVSLTASSSFDYRPKKQLGNLVENLTSSGVTVKLDLLGAEGHISVYYAPSEEAIQSLDTIRDIFKLFYYLDWFILRVEVHIQDHLGDHFVITLDNGSLTISPLRLFESVKSSLFGVSEDVKYIHVFVKVNKLSNEWRLRRKGKLFLRYKTKNGLIRKEFTF